jgi:dTDP-4-amino-4,6-dideoxygalactose transaminase
LLNHPSFAGWPSFSEDEAETIKDILLSNKVNYWTGDECRKFEKEFANWSGAKHAIALANGTLALELALRALDIGPGDEVVVTPRTFIASISCVINVGATPIFADVDLNSGNITAESISEVLTSKTKGIICVHFAGWPCDMDPIMELANFHGIKVIEDCAQAHGAIYKGRSVGSIGHIGAWSFCQDKIITTGGEGGMITTNDESLWRKMWAYKDHGKSYEAIYEREHPPGFRWVHESFGSNFRMIEIQAAIGRIQLKRISEWNVKRNQNAESIFKVFEPFKAIRIPHFKCKRDCEKDCASLSQCQHAQYKCYVYVDNAQLKEAWSRDRIVHEIEMRGVPCFQGGCSEVYLEKAFEGASFKPKNRLPIAKTLGDTSLMFLVHPTLTQDNIEKTKEVIVDVLSIASI